MTEKRPEYYVVTADNGYSYVYRQRPAGLGWVHECVEWDMTLDAAIEKAKELNRHGEEVQT